MRFTLTIQCGNAAFGDNDWERDEEIARILRDVAKHIELEGAHWRRIHDINGNRVGHYAFDADDKMKIDSAA